MSAKSHRGRLGRAVNLAIRKLGSRKRASRAGPPPHPPSLPRFLPAQRESLWVPNRQQKRSQLRDAEGRVGGGEGGLGRREACRGRLEDLSAPQAGRKMLLSPGPGSLRQNLLGGQSPLCPVFPGNRPLGEMTRDLFFPRGLAQSRAQP